MAVLDGWLNGWPGRMLCLMIGGSLGTLCRYGLSVWTHPMGRWPVGTFAANMLGCLIMGLIVGWLEARHGSLIESPLHWRLLWMTGFLGALTTFSTYELEAFLYWRDGLWLRAVAYLMFSLVLGMAVLMGGFHAARWLAGGRV